MSNDSSETSLAKPKTLPWGPAAAIVITIVAFLFAQVVAVFVSSGVSTIGRGSAEAETWLTSVSGQFVFVLISEILTLGILWWFLRRRHANIKQLGFTHRPQLRDAAYAAMGFLVYFVMLIAATSLLRSLTHIDLDQKQELGFENVLGHAAMLLTFVSLVMLPPIVEEVIFRGFLFSGLRSRLSFGWTALLTSLIFAAPHLLESSVGILWVAGIDTFLLSLVLCYLREKTGSLWASIGVHMLKNGLAFLFLYVFVTH